MARLPSTILSECSNRAFEYTLDLMKNPTYESVGFAQSTGSCILPYKDVVMSFQMSGYGLRKAEKWINEWNDMGLVKWRLNVKEQYMAFLTKPITDDQDDRFCKWLSSELQKHKETAKSLGF